MTSSSTNPLLSSSHSTSAPGDATSLFDDYVSCAQSVSKILAKKRMRQSLTVNTDIHPIRKEESIQTHTARRYADDEQPPNSADSTVVVSPSPPPPPTPLRPVEAHGNTPVRPPPPAKTTSPLLVLSAATPLPATGTATALASPSAVTPVALTTKTRSLSKTNSGSRRLTRRSSSSMAGAQSRSYYVNPFGAASGDSVPGIVGSNESNLPLNNQELRQTVIEAAAAAAAKAAIASASNNDIGSGPDDKYGIGFGDLEHLPDANVFEASTTIMYAGADKNIIGLCASQIVVPELPSREVRKRDVEVDLQLGSYKYQIRSCLYSVDHDDIVTRPPSDDADYVCDLVKNAAYQLDPDTCNEAQAMEWLFKFLQGFGDNLKHISFLCGVDAVLTLITHGVEELRQLYRWSNTSTIRVMDFVKMMFLASFMRDLRAAYAVKPLTQKQRKDQSAGQQVKQTVVELLTNKKQINASIKQMCFLEAVYGLKSKQEREKKKKKNALHGLALGSQPDQEEEEDDDEEEEEEESGGKKEQQPYKDHLRKALQKKISKHPSVVKYYRDGEFSHAHCLFDECQRTWLTATHLDNELTLYPDEKQLLDQGVEILRHWREERLAILKHRSDLPVMYENYVQQQITYDSYTKKERPRGMKKYVMEAPVGVHTRKKYTYTAKTGTSDWCYDQSVNVCWLFAQCALRAFEIRERVLSMNLMCISAGAVKNMNPPELTNARPPRQYQNEGNDQWERFKMNLEKYYKPMFREFVRDVTEALCVVQKAATPVFDDAQSSTSWSGGGRGWHDIDDVGFDCDDDDEGDNDGGDVFDPLRDDSDHGTAGPLVIDWTKRKTTNFTDRPSLTSLNLPPSFD